MNEKRSVALFSVILLALTLFMAAPVSAIDCEDCTWITSVDVKDVQGNDVFDDADDQVLVFGESGPPIQVTVHYELPGGDITAPPWKVICIVKGPSGETFVKKRQITEAGQYKYTAQYLLLPTGDSPATVKCIVKVKKRGLGLLGKDRVDVDIDTAPSP
jgi:hypothetical protein